MQRKRTKERISQGDRAMIQGLKRRGWGIYRISKRMNMNYSTVRRWYERDTIIDKPRNIKQITDRTK